MAQRLRKRQPVDGAAERTVGDMRQERARREDLAVGQRQARELQSRGFSTEQVRRALRATED